MSDQLCSEPGCTGSVRARGLCGAHYERERRAGNAKPRKDRRTCLVDGCTLIVVGHGYCDLHYRRFKRNGKPESRTAADRFWSMVSKDTEGSCWNWTGATRGEGYGTISIGGTKAMAHRFSYELHVGPIPKGLQIDHICRNRACVNPAHLEPVTQAVNVLRGVGIAAQHARRSTCIRGHSYAPPNGFITPEGHRGCRACQKIRREKHRGKTP